MCILIERSRHPSGCRFRLPSHAELGDDVAAYRHLQLLVEISLSRLLEAEPAVKRDGPGVVSCGPDRDVSPRDEELAPLFPQGSADTSPLVLGEDVESL